MRAISALSLLAGMSTRACLADTAFRKRVSMSEIGSVICVLSRQLPTTNSQFPTFRRKPWRKAGPGSWESGLGSLLPGALRHARDIAFERQLPEAQPAHVELPHERTRPSAQLAAIALANLVLR